MNKVVQVLMHEHQLIKHAIEHTRSTISAVQARDLTIDALRERIEFFRKYADGYHHYKEEEVLFPTMIDKNEMLEYGVVHEMLQNHEDFRQLLSELEIAVGENDIAAFEDKFTMYAEMMLEHIAVEDDEVFQIAETLLSEDELLTVLYRFEDCDRELGGDEKARWEQKA